MLQYLIRLNTQDKWRNLNVGTATQGSKEKSVKSPKIKAITDGPFSGTPNSLPIVLVSQDASCNAFIDNHSKNKSAGENAPRYVFFFFPSVLIVLTLVYVTYKS